MLKGITPETSSDAAVAKSVCDLEVIDHLNSNHNILSSWTQTPKNFV